MRRNGTLLSIFLFFFLVPFFLLSGRAFAEAAYTVKKGDTLYSIARKHKVTVGTLKKANRMAAEKLRPGQRIVVPGKTVARKGRSNADDARVSDAGTTSKDEKYHNDPLKSVRHAGDGDHYHTVRRGETLASIAKRYSVPADELKEMNDLSSSRIRKGQRLLVRRAGPRTYTVRKGDTISKIARKFDMDADDLTEINELEPGAPLTVGQKLYLQETADSVSAEAYKEIVAKSVEEELKKAEESEEVAAQDKPGRLITFAKKLINIPYKFGGNSILGIDCSAYVKKVYGFLGIELPRTAREQFNTGEAIDKEQLSVGDLVFFRTYASFPSHVGIYLGNDLFIHASSKGKKVTISNLETPYFLKRFIGAKRLLTEGIPEAEE